MYKHYPPVVILTEVDYFDRWFHRWQYNLLGSPRTDRQYQVHENPKHQPGSWRYDLMIDYEQKGTWTDHAIYLEVSELGNGRIMLIASALIPQDHILWQLLCSDMLDHFELTPGSQETLKHAWLGQPDDAHPTRKQARIGRGPGRPALAKNPELAKKARHAGELFAQGKTWRAAIDEAQYPLPPDLPHPENYDGARRQIQRILEKLEGTK